ncbi:MAG: hypothetical protein KJ556_15070 [Gammaproteobacteria bacterium]|nr:hypothetical protein [Gammaproteobacteria bacterium]MBU2058245.1 hypothetical protein [Gammaproteobacteria bacterium]MBU2176441.1 hypothetical protein [Gammaproteobacteria bacterium]MBU2246386.1 hypothetical protein [Gammaproteobacteria bacterium]MBU2342862.1 hypothetical protein [Gammaproteobacteria bacterium]
MKTEHELDVLIAGLASELKPARDLWPELEQRLTDPEAMTKKVVQLKPNRWLSVPFASAYVASAASVLFAVTLFWQPAAPVQPQVFNPQMLDAETAIVYSFEQAKAEQLASMKTVDPAYADWQQQLAQWQQAITLVQLALKYNPNEALLLKQLKQLYSQQQNYLQKVVQSGLV